jgi:pyruvate/2-oxoglutarate dehydrogenase complex dihydrolipoamide dehydrogenase (E3) component
MHVLKREDLQDLPQTRPLDEHNLELVKNVHPPDWANPEPAGRYNMVVIGGGTAGLVTAAGAALLGGRVALIERDLLGGDCLNVGCVPSKALIRSARAWASVRDAARYGVELPAGGRIDFGRVMERMRALRAKISRHDSAARFKSLGVDVYIGEGRFTGRDTIEVDGKTLRFAKACIATGGRPRVPPIDGLPEATYLTNETLFSLTELPRRLAVLGAGPIGCEMAQSFARFGSRVSLIETSDQILTREDRDAARRVEHALVDDGVELILGSKLSRVRRDSGGKTLTIEGADGPREIVVDEILIGAGRAPNVEGLGLETAGVESDKNGVTVNDRLQTTNSRVFAAGDVCFRYKFTHTADALARIVLQNALFGFSPLKPKASALTVPWCTYTDPEVAHVGLYPHQAEERGIAIDTVQVELDDVDRALLDGETEGFLKVHLKQGTDKIVGATLVASHAGEIISEITLAMVAGKGLGTIAKTIHPYPTQAEIVKKAADQYGRTRLSPFLQKVLNTLMRWQR